MLDIFKLLIDVWSCVMHLQQGWQNFGWPFRALETPFLAGVMAQLQSTQHKDKKRQAHKKQNREQTGQKTGDNRLGVVCQVWFKQNEENN